jgi:predicted phosphodiesterase
VRKHNFNKGLIQMNIIETIKRIFGSIIYDHVIVQEGVKVLHITDTPTISYGAILKLINKISPDYIIHTGDLADNIKLEIYPEKIDLYKKKVKGFILALESINCKKYVVIGNHDDGTYLEELSETTQIVHNFKSVGICDKNFIITHKLEDIMDEDALIESSDYILHGHSFYDELFNHHTKVLNGLKGIYLIYPEKDEVYHIDYPVGTNDSRMQRFGTGI